jgi:alanine racemase
MICVLKADAYGHGADLCCRALLREGCDFFAVSCIEEAVALRHVIAAEGARADILVLGYVPPEQVSLLVDHDVIATVYSPEYARRLSASAQACSFCVRVHLKLDTGMNRIGFCAKDPSDEDALRRTADELEVCAKLPGILAEGMFTHFAFAGEEDQPGQEPTEARCRRQADAFFRVAALLRERGVRPDFLHLCNSAGSLRFPEYHANGVRVGISLYGTGTPELPLRPVMRLVSRIVHLHTVLPGETVGYGGAYTADRERVVATVPIGYADGFLRGYAGALVTVQTAGGCFRAPLVGRICMDQCMLDVTGLGAREGDAVVLFGSRPRDLTDLAHRAGTIEYESLCLISGRVPRIPLDGSDPETENETKGWQIP